MILKSIKENDTMLDLVKNVKTNLVFYIKHRDELADLRYSNEELEIYIKKLNTVIDMYEKDAVQDWFKNYKAYLFMSGRFPYITPYLSFCFSFSDFVDTLLLIGSEYHDNNRDYIFQEVEYMDAGVIIPIFIDTKNSNIVKCESFNKDEWNKLKKNFK